MKFTVTRNSLLNELNLVQGVIEKKSTIPILSNILLEASGDRLDITATDLDVTIRCGCPASVDSGRNDDHFRPASVRYRAPAARWRGYRLFASGK